MEEGTMKDVMKFMEMGTATFSKEWRELTDTDKKQLKAGIGNGTLDY